MNIDKNVENISISDSLFNLDQNKPSSLDNEEYSIDICSKMADLSTKFEKYNTNLKKQYYIKNFNLYNSIVGSIDGYRGSFGTGYPFYSLGPDLSGDLPVIGEQIRYNNELKGFVESSGKSIWTCGLCLKKNAFSMPDLKQVCKPCPRMIDGLKPRKVINRLPDIDLWLVCDEEKIEKAKDKLTSQFANNNLIPSDIDPIRTFEDTEEIVNELTSGKMPFKNLPLDAHIIGYEELLSLISKVPGEVDRCSGTNEVPYLPILPWSYRKDWQKDDMAYNFVFDYFYSLTEFKCDSKLKKYLETTRNSLIEKYGIDNLYKTATSLGSDSVKRRLENKELQLCLKERLNSWKK